jgi:hypothetical protein
MSQPAKLLPADVEHLAFADELFHRLPDLLPRRRPVDVVHLVEVDVVGLQPAQAVLAGLATLLHVGRLWPAVDVGGVEEVDAVLERLVHDREAGCLVGYPAEVHRPERETADL